MPRKGRSRSLSRLSRNGQGHREARSKETQEQRLARLQSCRSRLYKSRLKQSADGTAERLANHRAEYRQKRNLERHTQRESMLALRRNRYNNAHEDGNHIQTQQQRELQQAIKTQKKLGKLKDVDSFQEKDFPEHLCSHKLPGLFDANHVCASCNAYRWREERPGFCCGQGKIHLQSLPSPPAEIQQLYDAANPDFLQKLRSYNNAFALASIGCDEKVVHGFSPTFKIQGKVYHRIGSLCPNDGETPKFAQIYFHDTDHEAENRLKHNPHLNLDIVGSLQNCLHRVNPYIQSFKSALDFAQTHNDVQIILKADKNPSTEHPRRYNLPTASEVAVIMPGEQAQDLDVILQTKTGDIQRINATHRSYDPLHYILLFPYGADGYTEKCTIPLARASFHQQLSIAIVYKYEKMNQTL